MLDHAAETLLNVVSDFDAEPDDINANVQSFFTTSETATSAQAEQAIQTLSAGFTLEDPMRSGLLAMVCGALLERGATPGQASVRFAQWLETALGNVGDERTDDALERFWPSAIAFFSKDPQARVANRHLGILLAPWLEERTWAFWIDKLLRVLHDEPILVIEPSTNLGFIGHMSGVSDNFQLHMLLLGLFPSRDRFAPPRISPEAFEVALGIGPQELRSPVSGGWDMQAWTAVQPNLSLATSTSEHWIWGEGIPTDIPVFDGYRVVLLGPASYSRSWTANRLFGPLSAEIRIVQSLSPEGIRSWLQRMADRAANN